MRIWKLAALVPERARRRHPVVLGVAEGALASALFALAWPLGIAAVTGSGVVLLLWVALASARPPIYQALVAICLALVFDALAGAPLGTRMLPLAGALLAASWAPGPITRWDVSHAGFAAYALVGWGVVTLTFAVLRGGFVAAMTELTATALLFLLASTLVGAWHLFTEGRPEGGMDDVPWLVRSLR
jgi:hypothetical protein